MKGPIDMLLALAREQKVDLTKISILKLADQYLAYIAAARRLPLEIAADYLVMAAWLAYLKSRLLLPQPPRAGRAVGRGYSPRRSPISCSRLEAMQQAGARLMARPLLGRDVFQRGAPEGLPRVLRAGLGGHALRPAQGLWRRAPAQGDRASSTSKRPSSIRWMKRCSGWRACSAACRNGAALMSFLPRRPARALV